MLINYVPGDECRVAVVEDDRLEGLHVERANAVSHVGNIYAGKVVNVEPSIQAAFIDFGLEHNGFLHISDLHPQYFPGEDEETKERVGKKTPRRERPPIQAALKRGQQIVVQVLKEGIGTKGPTLTSYLSIPGRCLVMMPQMDRVGVSRKVEDEETRRKMRQILDSLELPEGFGFILRTAGMDRSKAELKRDLAYLNRLWKDMQRRLSAGGKPRLLYAESDLLLRALRDMLTSDIDEVVIDDVSALRRAARFLKIFAPRSAPKLLHYDSKPPMFHVYGVEDQIKAIHSRRAPLPSGGYLIIDETEALVAIDVNSGKMRSHGDAETTAYKTNCEAIDEICRQMRLRDLGGLVVLDLIDMRHRSKRRDIEQRLRNGLKRDNARSKALPISQFGMIELTRQRMRGSVRSAHFASCPECEGTGLVQRPDSVASDAVRDLASVLQHERVRKVEMVVSPRVASELLSRRRYRLNRLEWETGKHVDVRVSETIPVDRVSLHAYDDRGADVDIERLPVLKPPKALTPWTAAEVGEVEDWSVDSQDEAAMQAAEMSSELEADVVRAEAEAEAGMPTHPLEETPVGADAGEGDSEEPGGGKRRRRRRRRRRKSGAESPNGQAASASQEEEGRTDRGETAEAAEPQDDGQGDEASTEQDGTSSGKRKRRRRGGRRRRRSGAARSEQEQTEEPTGAEPTTSQEPSGDAAEEESQPPKGKKKRSRRGSGKSKEPAPAADVALPDPAKVDAEHLEKRAAEVFPARGDSWDLDPVLVPVGHPAASDSAPQTDAGLEDQTPAAREQMTEEEIEAESQEQQPAPEDEAAAADPGKAKRKSRGTSKKKSTRKKSAASKKTSRKKKSSAGGKASAKKTAKKKSSSGGRKKKSAGMVPEPKSED